MTKDPWLDRKDWAEGRVRDTRAEQSVIGLWILAIGWNALTWPAFYLFRDYLLSGNPTLYAFFFSPLVGVALVYRAIRDTWQRLRDRIAICELERVPIEPGRVFRGTVELKGADVPHEGFRITLNGHRQPEMLQDETVEWQDEIIVPAIDVARNAFSIHIPFSFAIPPDAHESREVGDDDYFWRLSIEGGSRYALFKLPVFLNGPVDGREFAETERTRMERAGRSPLPVDSGITVRELAEGGVEIEVRPRVPLWRVVSPALFLAALLSAIAGLLYYKGPAGVTMITAAIALILAYILIDALFGRSRVRVHAGRIMTRRNTIELSAIKSLSTSVGRVGSATQFEVYARMVGRYRVTLVRHLRTRQEADAVAARIRAALDHAS